MAYESLYELAYKTGVKARSAVPVLLHGLCDTDAKIGESCLWALRYCQPTSIPGLVECLSHRHAFIRERAAHSLGNIGDDARIAAAGALRMCLSDSDHSVRDRAAWSLGLMHDGDALTLSLLGKLVTQGATTDRRAALHALGNIGKALEDPTALDALRESILAALEDPDDDVRWSALYASKSLDLDLEARVGLLSSLLAREQAERVLSAALDAIKSIAGLADLRHLTARLIDLLGNRRLVRSVCEVLEAMRPAPSEVAPFLVAFLDDEEYRIPAGRALFRITGRAEQVVAALARLPTLDEGDCDLICELGPSAGALVPCLIESLSNDSWDLQWAAADALSTVAREAHDAIPALLEALNRPSPIVRSAAARALAQAGPAAVVPLCALVRQHGDRRMPWAAFALETMGAAALPALPDLREGMHAADPRVERACAFALARLAGDASTVPILIATLLDRDPEAPRRAAAEALGSLGPAAKAAVKSLKRALKDDDAEVVEAAQEALASILKSAH